MDIGTAVKLIEKGVAKTSSPQLWADLGAGQGLFTRALASLLGNDSIIYAIDKDAAALAHLDDSNGSVLIRKTEKDFIKNGIGLRALDGILMANSFHYVPDQVFFIKQIRASLKPGGRLLLVEYDTDSSNQWVPYTISYNSLQRFAAREGLGHVTWLAEAPSIYSRSNIYSAVLNF